MYLGCCAVCEIYGDQVGHIPQALHEDRPYMRLDERTCVPGRVARTFQHGHECVDLRDNVITMRMTVGRSGGIRRQALCLS